ncbi:MAG: thiolase family protein [Deltaproteobacteria bacterium]|nr:thiolase family protein [Deltaproteobacteria bacterium]MBI3295152.1 thiolase family protein [Deltaproteobacteria bacterium]
MKDVVILAAVRTPIASFLGSFKDISASQLAAHCLTEAVNRAKVPGEMIDECLMGCVLPAGMGQAPARQSVIFANLPQSIRCTTVNRVCGSGLKTVMMATQMIQTGDANIVLAGGMESMTRAPYLLDRAREGYRLGNGKIVDSMISDGLWDVYNNFHMGTAAELCAKEKKISRSEQDEYALMSYQRAQLAAKEGLLKREIVPIEATIGKETRKIDADEEPFKAKLDRLGQLSPVFDKAGTVTAGNASSLADGACVLILADSETAKKLGTKPVARVVAQASHAQAPEWFTTAPVGSLNKLAAKAKIALNQIDRFEINEAFSVVALACVKELGLDMARVNVRGGAVAMGHPIGASGARILTTLLHTLQDEKKQYGAASLCIGGGEASALLIENLG